MDVKVQLLAEVEQLADAIIPTPEGCYRMVVFREVATGREHVAMVMGDVAGRTVLARIHSECMTGDLFGSLRCDCGDQLAAARVQIAAAGAGVILYLRQEGRGIGLANKLRAYRLQDKGMDTVEANLHLGLPADERRFEVAASMLECLRIPAVRLMTNNPRKLSTLANAGITIVERVALQSVPRPENRRYLETKASKLGHQMDWLTAEQDPPI